jgi:hypothetical protein
MHCHPQAALIAIDYAYFKSNHLIINGEKFSLNLLYFHLQALFLVKNLSAYAGIFCNKIFQQVFNNILILLLRYFCIVFSSNNWIIHSPYFVLYCSSLTLIIVLCVTC